MTAQDAGARGLSAPLTSGAVPFDSAGARAEIVTDLEEELEVKIAERVLEDNLTLRDVVRLAEQSGG